PAGSNLSLQPSPPALTSGANTIPALAGTIAAPTTMPSDRWGFCVPNTHAQNVANGFTTSCTVSPLFAAVPTAPTIIKNVDTLPTTPDQQNTPIHFGVRTTATSAPGTYTSLVTITAAINTP
ncbi:hypothetical protein FWH13_03155, partial [Candidatus Saccharibacteria bacterium]|nr:hypothetical protein [Candidatus Saccharibacteria bacterium]